MTRRNDISDYNPLTGKFNLPVAARSDVLTDDGRAAAREVEICQKIEIEIAFRHRLVAALDKKGYIVKSGMIPEKQDREFFRKKYENEPGRASRLWTLFFAQPKDDSVPFCLAVWFSSDVPTPSSFKWRPLGIDGMSVAGPFKRTVWNGVTFIDATPAFGHHVSVINARLQFESLSLPTMRDSLRDGHLAEELASKIALAFDRLSAFHAD